VFGSVKEYSPLYGGRLFDINESLSYKDVDFLSNIGINLMLTLSNHFYTEEKYKQTIHILERLHRKGNSIVITNDNLAIRIRKDFPLFALKASVIKSIKTLDEIHKALEIYDFVTLDSKLNDQAEFLQSIDCKDNIVLFASNGCPYHCPKSLCYEYISLRMNPISFILPGMIPCANEDRRTYVTRLTIFDLNSPGFAGFKYFKIIPGYNIGNHYYIHK